MTSVRYVPAISTDAGAIPVSTEVATHPRAGDGFEVQDVFLQQLADLIEARTQTPTIANAINVQSQTGATNNYAIYTNAGLVRFGGVVLLVQATTAGAPAYKKGGLYFDTTLNKLRVGGATAWETVTSS